MGPVCACPKHSGWPCSSFPDPEASPFWEFFPKNPSSLPNSSSPTPLIEQFSLVPGNLSSKLTNKWTLFCHNHTRELGGRWGLSTYISSLNPHNTLGKHIYVAISRMWKLMLRESKDLSQDSLVEGLLDLEPMFFLLHVSVPPLQILPPSVQNGNQLRTHPSNVT